MKPSALIRKKCKTNRERLEVALSLIDYFMGEEEVDWAIQTKKMPRKARKRS